MRFTPTLPKRIFTLVGRSCRRKQALAGLFATALLGGCGGDFWKDPVDALTPRLVQEERGLDFVYGSLAGDESYAVVAAHETMANGGSAADAAVTMYFMLAVTQPASAGLGGGGVCLVHNPLAGQVEVLDFISPAATGGGQVAVAVPTSVRGMAALHARYGRLGWSQLVRPAEDLAREGVPMGRGLRARLEAHAGRLYGDREVQDIFADSNGLTLPLGTLVRQFDLGAALGQIRARGAGEFYAGPLGRGIVQAVQAEGGNLTMEDLRRYLPQWRAPVAVDIGPDRVHAAPPPATMGMVAAGMWQMLSADGRYAQAGVEERPHLMVEAAKRALADRTVWLAQDGSPRVDPASLVGVGHAGELMRGYRPDRATPMSRPSGPLPGDGGDVSGFVIVDGQGVAVACTVGLYSDFGTGRMAPRTGFFLAPPPGYAAHSPFGLGPLMVTDPARRTVRYAIAGGGGAEVASAMVATTLATLADGMPLREAIATARVHHAGWPDQAVVEQAAFPALRQSLEARGHSVVAVPAIGRVNAVFCPAGVPAGRRPQCVSAPDPRGEGLGINLEPER